MSRRIGFAILFLCAGATAHAAGGHASIESARMLFGPRYRPGRPFPVEVRARAGSRAAAWAEIADGGHRYRARLALEPGSAGPKRLWAVLGDDPTGARVRLLDADGEVLAERELEPAPRPLARNQRLVVVVGRRRLPTPSAPHLRFVRLPPEDLPKRACAWQGADLVVIDDLSAAKPKAVGALGEWFRAGGRAILASSAADHGAEGELLRPGWATKPWEELKQAGARDRDVLAWLKEGEPAAFRFRRAFGEGVVLRFDHTALGREGPSRSRPLRAVRRAFMLMLLEGEPGSDPRVDPALYAAMPDPWESLPRAGAAARTALVLLAALAATAAIIWRARRRGRAVLLAAAGFALAGTAFASFALPRADLAVGMAEVAELSGDREARFAAFALLSGARGGTRRECYSVRHPPRVIAPSAGRLRAWNYVVDITGNAITTPELGNGERAIVAAGPLLRPYPFGAGIRMGGLPAGSEAFVRWASARCRGDPDTWIVETLHHPEKAWFRIDEAVIAYRFAVDFACSEEDAP